MNIEDFITYVNISIYEPKIYQKEIFDISMFGYLKSLVLTNINSSFQFRITKQNNIEYTIYGHTIRDDQYSIVWAPQDTGNIKQETIHIDCLSERLDALLHKALV